MARYTVSKSYVNVVGEIWMPYGAPCSLRIDLSGYDIQNIRDIADYNGNETITRDDVDQWLSTHAGDFSHVIDFEASISFEGQDLDFDFATDEGLNAYLNTQAYAV